MATLGVADATLVGPTASEDGVAPSADELFSSSSSQSSALPNPLSTPANAKRCAISSRRSHERTVPSVLLSGTATQTRLSAHGVSTQASATHMAKEPEIQAVALPGGQNQFAKTLEVTENAPVHASVSAMPANCWFMNRAVIAFSRYCVGAVELRMLARRASGAASLRSGAKSASEQRRSVEAAERRDMFKKGGRKNK
jgi:hypothetical protein